MADTVRVTLWFDTPLEDVRRHLGDDFKLEAGEGITVEAMAAALVRNHHAKHGYIGWRVHMIDGAKAGLCTCPVTTEGRWDEEHDPGCPAR